MEGQGQACRLHEGLLESIMRGRDKINRKDIFTLAEQSKFRFEVIGRRIRGRLGHSISPDDGRGLKLCLKVLEAQVLDTFKLRLDV